ncbi:MAG: EAL domain-containing protein [Actinomycetota bacterium]
MTIRARVAAWRLTRVGVATVICGVVASLVGAAVMVNVERGRQRSFTANAAEAEAAIETRLAVYEEVLEGIRGLYRSDFGVDRAEFHRFVDVDGLIARWPGIDVVGFARRLPAEAVPAYESAVRSDTTLHVGGYPDFAVRPQAVVGADAVVLEFVEPMAGNEASLGFDLSSDPDRAAAMIAARDTGQPSATAPVQLENRSTGASGVVLLAPLFDGDATRIADRRANIAGYVVAKFRVDEMLSEATATVPLGVTVVDASVETERAGLLLGGDDATGRELTFDVSFGGRTWLVQVHDGASSLPLGVPGPAFVAAIGLVLTLLLTVLFENLVRSYRDVVGRAALGSEVRLDPITGLLNRFGLAEAVAVELEAADDPAKVAVVLLDIDMFKRVNDERGRAAGDDLLRAVGRAIQRSAGDDAFAGRLVGDQFAVVLCDRTASGERALALAHGVRRLIATIHEVGRIPIAVTATVGLAYGRDADSEVLLNDAGAALHEAKRAGGDRVEVFDQKLRQRLERQMRLETDLRVAVQERQFVLRYQPQASARTGEIVGFEVLIRWEHPEMGLLGPQDFVEVAEQAGIVQHLDRFVIEEAARQQRAWREQLGRPVELGVNLSGVTLVKDAIVDVVRQALTRYEMHPSDLCIEITETAIIDSPELAQSRLEALRALSVRIDLDDFGTGYSSLTHLQRMPLTGIKVDRCFVSGMTTEAKDAAIVEASIRLAQQLGLRVVAEGVEDTAQAAYLDALDCDLLQGYLVGRPLSPEQATELLAAGTIVPVTGGSVRRG